MAVSLYDLSVTNYLQTLGAVEGFVGKSLTAGQQLIKLHLLVHE